VSGAQWLKSCLARTHGKNWLTTLGLPLQPAAAAAPCVLKFVCAFLLLCCLPSRPAKYFSIDRVFRNEAVDRTHLAEFHQVRATTCCVRCRRITTLPLLM